MPELTQQQWLAQQLRLANLLGTADDEATRLLSAYPSSPQGIAVKQVMEVMAEANALLEHAYYGRPAIELPGLHEAMVHIQDAQEDARKAGLT